MRISQTESQEQQELFRWVEIMKAQYHELRLLYHVPNEGFRSPRTGARLRAEGLRKGVPDLCLPVARGPYHGLYIELKRETGGKLTEEQKVWLADLATQGYRAVMCKGWTEASAELIDYLTEGKF